MVRYGVVRRAAVVGEEDRVLVWSYRNASVGARADVVATSRPDRGENRVCTTCLGWVHVSSMPTAVWSDGVREGEVGRSVKCSHDAGAIR